MNLTCYRLFQYEIIQNDLGDMWWEFHAAFGDIKRGKCFVIDDILMLDAGKFDGPGYLMLEYHERLSMLPVWNKTIYYCQNPSVYSCITSKKVDLSKIKAIQSAKQLDPNVKEMPTGSENSSYRLGKYEIVEKSDGDTTWKTFAGYTGIKEGRCSIRTDILFMESGKIEDKLTLKKDFLRQIAQLPEWHQTRYFCPNVILCPCITETEKKKRSVDISYNLPPLKNLNQNASIEKNSMEGNYYDQKEKISSTLRWVTFIKTLIYSLVEFSFNLFLELIGIRKK